MDIKNGRPEITETGARMKPQGMGGYCPPGRNFPTSGRFTTPTICDPYVDQDEMEEWD